MTIIHPLGSILESQKIQNMGNIDTDTVHAQVVQGWKRLRPYGIMVKVSIEYNTKDIIWDMR